MATLTRLGTLKATTDTAVVRWLSGAWDFATNIAPLYVGYDNAGVPKYGGGMRFLNITIPQGAIIASSILRFEAGLTKAETVVNSYFTGELAPDATTFSSLADFQSRRGTVVGGPNNNNRTIAQVAWDNIPAHTDGVNYDSPDIKVIIQEIVNQATWASGNDLVIFWDDYDGRSTQANGTYRALEWGATGYFALIITYTQMEVQTDAATSVTQTSATSNGTLISGGPAACNFQWGKTTNYENSETDAVSKTDGQSFSFDLTNLDPGTTYHFRAKAVDPADSNYIVYGSDKSFTTDVLALPLDKTLRVSGLVHRFSAGEGGRPGIYKLEVLLGGLSSIHVTPVSMKEPTPTLPPPGALYYALWDNQFKRGLDLSDYGTWLSQHTQAEIMAVFGHAPTFAEWVAWY